MATIYDCLDVKLINFGVCKESESNDNVVDYLIH
jgi:hypothetical protein